MIQRNIPINPGTALARLADCTLALVSDGAGEAATLVNIKGVDFIRCDLSTTPGHLFQADATFPDAAYLGHANTFQFPVRYADSSTACLAGARVDVSFFVTGAAHEYIATLSLEDFPPNSNYVISHVVGSSLTQGDGAAVDLQGNVCTKLRIEITAGSAATGKPVYVALPTVNASRKGSFLLNFYGQDESLWTFARPILAKHGLKANVYLIHKDIGAAGNLDQAQLITLDGEGHALCHHTFGAATHGWENTTDWPNLSAYQKIVDDIDAALDWFDHTGCGRGKGHVCYGYSKPMASTVSAVRKELIWRAWLQTGVKTVMDSGAWLAASGKPGSLSPIASPLFDFKPVKGIKAVTSTDTVDLCKAYIDQVEATGEAGGLLFHKLVISGAGSLEMNVADFDTVLAYLAGKINIGTVVNLTVDELYEGRYESYGACGAIPSLTGPTGAAGKTLLYGAIAPTTEGANGDFYIDTVTKTLYGPKAGGTWPGGSSLTGPTGAAGKTLLNGAGAPGSGVGANGDFYIDTTATAIYGPKAGGAWGSPTSLIGGG